MKKKIILSRIFHRGEWRILVSFKYDIDLTNTIRQIPGSSYTGTYKGWYMSDSEEVLRVILKLFREKADIDISSLTKNPRRETSEIRQFHNQGRKKLNLNLLRGQEEAEPYPKFSRKRKSEEY